MPLLQNSGDLNINISRLFAWTTDKTQPNPAVYNFYLSGAYALDQRWALTAGYARERHHLNIYSVGPAHWYQSKNDGILTTDNLTIGGIWRNRYNTKKVFTIAAQATYIAQEGSNILYTPYNSAIDARSFTGGHQTSALTLKLHPYWGVRGKIGSFSAGPVIMLHKILSDHADDPEVLNDKGPINKLAGLAVNAGLGYRYVKATVQIAGVGGLTAGSFIHISFGLDVDLNLGKNKQ